MIRVSGDYLQNANMLTLDPIEKVIFNRLLEDPLTYAYRNLYELEFEIQLRSQIIHSAKLMNDSQATFEVFAQSRRNPDYWIRTMMGGFY